MTNVLAGDINVSRARYCIYDDQRDTHLTGNPVTIEFEPTKSSRENWDTFFTDVKVKGHAIDVASIALHTSATDRLHCTPSTAATWQGLDLEAVLTTTLNPSYDYLVSKVVLMDRICASGLAELHQLQQDQPAIYIDWSNGSLNAALVDNDRYIQKINIALFCSGQVNYPESSFAKQQATISKVASVVYQLWSNHPGRAIVLGGEVNIPNGLETIREELEKGIHAAGRRHRDNRTPSLHIARFGALAALKGAFTAADQHLIQTG